MILGVHSFIPEKLQAKAKFASRNRPLLFTGRMGWIATLLTLVAVLWLHPAIYAQVAGTGSISGTIADPSGAVVQGAQVTATNVGTGLKATQETSSSGSFTLSALPPGDYLVEVQSKGFETSRQQVTLNALTQLGVNITLHQGDTTNVVVTAQAPELQTENGQVETTIPNSTYEALPIPMNGGPKSPIGFLSLVPGVTQNNQFGAPVINGGIIASSLIYVNGLPLATAELQGGIENLNTISTEDIDQFQVISSGVPANYDGQGIINLSYKSGTNQFHGTVFENLRNTALDAPGFGNTKAREEHQNEYGAAVGGPILRDRIFFFGSYDQYKITNGTTPVYVTVPTVAERAGDFSALPVQIYDPSTTTRNSSGILTRQPFANNQVPVLSNVAKALEASLPTPQLNTLQNNYSNSYTNGNKQWVYLAKIDAKITSKDRLSGLFETGKGTPLSYGGSLPVPYSSARSSTSTWYIAQLNETHVFTSNLLNYLGTNFVRNESLVSNPTSGGGWPTKVGLKGLAVGQVSDIFPQISFGGTDSPNGWDEGNTGFAEVPTSETAQDNVTWTHGRHNFTFGGQLTFEQEALKIPSQYTSGFNFGSNETAGLDASGNPIPGTGSGYASFLLGLVDNLGFQDYAVEETGGRWQNYAVYAQDDWKVTPRLVVNIGLRYSIPKPFTEVHNRTSWLNPNIPNPAVSGSLGVLEFAGTGANTCNCRTNVKTHYLTFGPRIGFAYSATPKTVIRSAFSIVHFNGGALGGNGEQQGVGNQGYATAPSFNSIDGGITPAFGLDNGVPAYQHPPFFSPTLATGFNTATPHEVGGVSYDRPDTAGRSPYTEEWNFTVEQQLPFAIVTNLTYAGTSSHFNGVNGGLGIYSNQIDPKYLALGALLNAPASISTIAQAQAIIPGIKVPYANYAGPIGQMLRPFAQYNAQGGTFQGPDPWSDFGTSSYNALQATLQRNMKGGLYLLASYTWSKSMDEGGDGVNFVASRPRTAYNLRAERSVSLLDVPQAFSLTEVYTLPFGKDSMFDSHNKIVNGIIGNWQLSATEQYSSGTPMGTFGSDKCNAPYTGGCYADYNPSFAGNPRINGKIGSHLSLSTPYINPAAFRDPANYTLGNTPRTLPYAGLRNEGSKNENVAIAKTFPITEKANFQFKADAFNLLNRVQLGGMNTDVSSSAFGQVNGQSNAPRELQLEGYIRF